MRQFMATKSAWNILSNLNIIYLNLREPEAGCTNNIYIIYKAAI